jgi:Ca2+-binding RTX toxin-like protein
MVQLIEGDGGPNLLQGDQGTADPRPLDDRIRGLGGPDTLSGGGGRNTLSGGGGGIDTADYEYASPQLGAPQQGVDGSTSSLWNAFGGVDVLRGIENVSGTDAFGDKLSGGVGSDAANRLDGRGGDDSLWGFGGDDTLVGGAGVDSIEGGEGRDRLFGGDGSDGLWGGRGADVAAGGGGDDTFVFYDFDDASGFNDFVLDPSDHDRIRGFAGAGPSAAGEQDQIIIGLTGLGSLVEVADAGTLKTYLVREDGVDLGYLTVESLNGEDLVVGNEGVPGVDVVFL